MLNAGLATVTFLGGQPVTWHTWVQAGVAVVCLPTSVALWRRLDREDEA